MVSTKLSLVDVDNLIWLSATILSLGMDMTTWRECLKYAWIAWLPTRVLELKYLQANGCWLLFCKLSVQYQMGPTRLQDISEDPVPLVVCGPLSPLF